MTVDHDVVVCDVGSVSSTSTTAADVQERVAELLRRPVVDDRIDARVEVRQTVPQHAHRLQYIDLHHCGEILTRAKYRGPYL